MPKKLTQSVFIERSNQKHSNVYDYSLVEYVSSHLKVKIICSKHGIFEQQPYAHINGQGCPTCSKNLLGQDKKKNLQTLLTEFEIIHQDRFDYSLEEYVNNSTKVKIICKKHSHMFYQTPKSHLKGSINCTKCLKEVRTKQYQLNSFESFKTEAEKVYGSYYSYDLTSFVYRLNVDVTCPKHGTFSTTQRNFLKSQGCSICHPKKYSDTTAYTKTHYTSLCKDGSNLYLFKFVKNNESFYKIGISNNIPRRVKSLSKYYDVEVVSVLFQKDPSIVWDLERMFHKLFKKTKYTPSVLFHGSNECFQLNTMQLKQYFDKLKEYVSE